TAQGHTEEVTALAFSPDGRTLASGDSGGTVKLWDPVIGQERATLVEHAGAIAVLVFGPDSRTLLALPSISPQGVAARVRMWQAVPGPRIFALGIGTGIRNVAISPENRFLVLQDEEDVTILDTATGERIDPSVAPTQDHPPVDAGQLRSLLDPNQLIDRL